MQKIIFEKMVYRNEKRIKLIFNYHKETIDKVREIPGRRWSNTMKYWHVPENAKSIQKVVELGLISEEEIKCHPAFIQKSDRLDLNSYYQQYKSHMQFRRYSENTIRVYLSMIQIFYSYHKTKMPNKISYQDILSFNQNYIISNGFSYNYQNQMISAIKLFFKQIENVEYNIENLERPKRQRTLPVILSKGEIKKILKEIKNIKHIAIITLIYSAGLRVSEAINMKLTDIDSERNVIYIRQAKGKKDRIVNLSPQLLKMLRQYVATYRPKIYLFNGQKSIQYTPASIRKILRKYCNKAGIKKDVKVHTLRHSFATHMLEMGVDIRYIQDMLGHNNIKTTMLYTQVSKQKISTFANPLDEFGLNV